MNAPHPFAVPRRPRRFGLALLAAGTLLAAGDLPAGDLARQFESMRLAVDDLIASFPDQYPDGPEYLRRLGQLQG